LQLDKDTQGVPGTPPIVETIFDKISVASIFVPDLTFIAKSESNRLIPNPNVLIEYGWALKELGHSRMVPVMNTAFGEPSSDNMPFDMRHLRNPITYHLDGETSAEEKKAIKADLIKSLRGAIELILENVSDDQPKKIKFESQKVIGDPATFHNPNVAFLTSDRLGSVDKKLYLPDEQKLFLRIIPREASTKITSSKVAKDTIQQFPLQPMKRPSSGGYGFSFERNEYGAFSYSEKDGTIDYFTQLFKTGEIWGIDNKTINKDCVMKFSKVDFGYFAGKAVEEVFLATLANYLKFAEKILELALPLKFIAGATRVMGYQMALPQNMWMIGRFGGRVIEDHITYEGEILDFDFKPIDILTWTSQNQKGFHNK